MDARIQALPFDPAALHRLSSGLIESHHQNNYGGAVKRLNAIRAQLGTTAFATVPGFQLNGLKREELIATNSMLLHELYFGSLGGDGQSMEPAWKLALDANFGSVDRWREEFVAMGKALGGGSGWVLLVFQPSDGTLVNQWAADHTHAVAGGVPLLALDMYEHAYHMDYGAAAGAYVDAFMGNIDWAAVYGRYQRAVHAASEPFGAAQDEIADAVLLDVRRAGVFEQAASMLPGARWCDPAAVGRWAAELPADRDVVVYCVYGHEVGRATAMRLRAAGLNARYLRGGIDGWQARRPADADQRNIDMKWITRERPKIDRIACPWLVTRFVDAQPEFLYVPGADVMRIAHETGATPYDVPNVELGHHGELCSFDAFIAKYELRDAALAELALIVRAADCGHPEAAPRGCGPAGRVAGLVAELRRRSRHAGAGPGALRRAVRALCRPAGGTGIEAAHALKWTSPGASCGACCWHVRCVRWPMVMSRCCCRPICWRWATRLGPWA